MKHESSYSSQLPLSNYAMSIQELEELTGYDFFCNLPDDIEREVENMEETKMLNDWSVQ
jgi:endonuclease G